MQCIDCPMFQKKKSVRQCIIKVGPRNVEAVDVKRKPITPKMPTCTAKSTDLANDGHSIAMAMEVSRWLDVVAIAGSPRVTVAVRDRGLLPDVVAILVERSGIDRIQ